MKTLRSLFLLSCLATLMTSCGSKTENAFRERPNIVFIMADDLGYNDLGCYGQEKILTPNIDRLATRGLRFTDFYAGAAVCAPSRATLQTGMHTGHTLFRGNNCRTGGLRKPPGREGIPDGDGNSGTMRMGLPHNEPNIARVLSEAGYHTGLLGKWHLSGYLYDNLPVRYGYDEYMGSSLADRQSTRSGFMFQNDSVVPIPEEFKADSRDETWTLLAIDFMERNREKPFMLMLNLSTPHKPFRINDQGIYADSSWNEMTRNYAALVSRLDRHVGMVMEALEEIGLEDNTILIFCSDNGGEYREVPEEWAEWTTTFESNKPLRGGKADFYEGGIRVPFIIRWPEVIEPGIESSQPLYFPDILPTLAEIAGTRIPDECDGVSMLDILTGEQEKLEDRFMYWEFEHRGFHQAVRHGDWVMLRYLQKQQRVYGQAGMDERCRSKVYPFYELYNLKEDISEKHNLIEENPEVATMMLEYLKTARKESPYYPLTKAEQASLDTLNLTKFR